MALRDGQFAIFITSVSHLEPNGDETRRKPARQGGEVIESEARRSERFAHLLSKDADLCMVILS